MKILHCLDHYMPLHMAGTEIYVQTLATVQKSEGHEVSVLTPFFSYYPNRQFTEHYLYEGVDVYQYMEDSNPTNKDFLFNRKLPNGIKAFERKLDLLNPDIVHFHELTRSIGFGVEHIKIAKKKAKVILTLHLAGNTCNTNNLIYNNKLCDGEILRYRCSVCSLQTGYYMPGIISKPIALMGVALNRAGITNKMPLGKITTVLAMPATIQQIKNRLNELVVNVDQLVSLTDWYKRTLLLNGVPSSKVTVIHQALANINYVKKKQQHSSGTTFPVKMVFIGRIQSQKGIHLLIEAMKNFNATKIYLDIYGKPEDTPYYKKCINDSIGMNTINWKGLINRDAVLSMLSEYDILCLPSTFSEMSPLVIQEAFAAGIPVLASKVYGNVEQIKDGKNGLLFDFNSTKSLQQKIKQLINNPPLLENIKSNITPPNSFQSIADAYMQVYQQ